MLKVTKNHKTKLRPFVKSGAGFIISIITFFVLIIMLSIAITMSTLIFYRQQIATNSFRSTQSYYVAEAGVEDALMRIRNSPYVSFLPYSFNVASASSNVTISYLIGTSRTIVSQGDNGNIIKTIQAVYNLDSQGTGASFYYGAQVGDGGLVGCNNNCVIKGNVFSNGNITGKGLTIDNNAIVAKNGNKIDAAYVKGSAKAYSCSNKAKIDGDFTYVTGGGTGNCTILGSTSQQSDEVLPEAMPILQSQIDGWKSEAASGTVLNNGLILSNGEIRYLGPAKIVGNLTLNNNSSLILTGTVYVTGNIIMQNNATINLDNNYGPSSGIILMDGAIDIKNNAILEGSGQSGSYIMVLSTSSSDTAISVSQNVQGAILYTSAGGITLNQNMQARQITAYKVIIKNNVTLEYEVGLSNSFFSSGTGGVGKIISWQEQ